MAGWETLLLVRRVSWRPGADGAPLEGREELVVVLFAEIE